MHEITAPPFRASRIVCSLTNHATPPGISSHDSVVQPTRKSDIQRAGLTRFQTVQAPNKCGSIFETSHQRCSPSSHTEKSKHTPVIDSVTICCRADFHRITPLIVIDGMHEGGSPRSGKNHLSHAESDVYIFWLSSVCLPDAAVPPCKLSS